MRLQEFIQWANNNQGVVAVLVVVLPAVLIFLYQRARVIWPSRREKTRRIIEEFAHAERMKKELTTKTEWDKERGYYGVFLIRDAERRLPETEENHSANKSPYSIAILTDIHTEHLEFSQGSLGHERHIKQISES